VNGLQGQNLKVIFVQVTTARRSLTQVICTADNVDRQAGNGLIRSWPMVMVFVQTVVIGSMKIRINWVMPCYQLIAQNA